MEKPSPPQAIGFSPASDLPYRGRSFRCYSDPESRAAAEHAYGDEWHRRVVERYGAEPRVTYFASPVIVDNLSGQILGG